jgi:hypothetical protein
MYAPNVVYETCQLLTNIFHGLIWLIDFCGLTPLSAIFQLYHGAQF